MNVVGGNVVDVGKGGTLTGRSPKGRRAIEDQKEIGVVAQRFIGHRGSGIEASSKPTLRLNINSPAGRAEPLAKHTKQWPQHLSHTAPVWPWPNLRQPLPPPVPPAQRPEVAQMKFELARLNLLQERRQTHGGREHCVTCDVEYEYAPGSTSRPVSEARREVDPAP